MKVIYEDNHLLVIEKPVNVPMQKDLSNDLDLLTMVKQYLKEKYKKPGNVYAGLVHRLDRPVGGVCVFAKTSKAAARLSRQVQERSFNKQYLAVVLDNNLKDFDCFEDFLSKHHKTNTSYVDSNGKYSKLEYQILEKNHNHALVLIKLYTGRSHQIRVQFASRNHPLYGDHRYNKNVIKNSSLALWSHTLSFKHPISQEELTFSSFPNNFPYNMKGVK